MKRARGGHKRLSEAGAAAAADPPTLTLSSEAHLSAAHAHGNTQPTLPAMPLPSSPAHLSWPPMGVNLVCRNREERGMPCTCTHTQDCVCQHSHSTARHMCRRSASCVCGWMAGTPRGRVQLVSCAACGVRNLPGLAPNTHVTAGTHAPHSPYGGFPARRRRGPLDSAWAGTRCQCLCDITCLCQGHVVLLPVVDTHTHAACEPDPRLQQSTRKHLETQPAPPARPALPFAPSSMRCRRARLACALLLQMLLRLRGLRLPSRRAGVWRGVPGGGASVWCGRCALVRGVPGGLAGAAPAGKAWGHRIA